MGKPARHAYSVLGVASLAGAVLVLGACPVVYPEVKTPLRPAIVGQALHPSPPADLRWVAFKGAKIPKLMRNGRKWGDLAGGKLPDPYAKLLVNREELLETDAQRQTLEPTWPNSKAGNFRIREEDKLRVELWDARVMKDHPMCVRELSKTSSERRMFEEMEIRCDSGARITVAVEPAHGEIGYGFRYEIRTYDVYVTGMYQESPATRSGMRSGDQIVSVNGKRLHGMGANAIRSLFNAPRPEGLQMVIRHEDGSTMTFKLTEGAVYPLFDEYGTIR